MNLFETKAREIFRYICPFQVRGIVNPIVGRIDPQSARRMRYADFVKAQSLIIEELKTITASKRNLNAQVKTARRNRDKVQASHLARELKQEQYKETIIRKLADSIAWQLIDGRSDFVQWLYSYSEPPALDESNLVSVLEEVNKLNQADPLSFALISDLTSFVQVGDILKRDTSGIIQVLEVKEGKENIKAMDIVENELMGERDELSLEKLKSVYGSSLMKQVERIQRQIAKGNRVKEIINTGEGQDPATGTPVRIREPSREPATYTSELADHLLRLDKGTWSYTIIEDCLMVGCYKGLMKEAGKSLILSLAQASFQESFIVVDLKEGLRDAMGQPIFLKPFREDDIFDIIFDRTRVFLVLNLDWLVQSFRERGAKADWLSRKETTKLMRETSKSERPFVFKGTGKAISVENDQWSMYLADGLFRRIFFGNVLPSWVVSMLLDSLNNQS